jgi:hypothetical protein
MLEEPPPDFFPFIFPRQLLDLLKPLREVPKEDMGCWSGVEGKQNGLAQANG